MRFPQDSYENWDPSVYMCFLTFHGWERQSNKGMRLVGIRIRAQRVAPFRSTFRWRLIHDHPQRNYQTQMLAAPSVTQDVQTSLVHWVTKLHNTSFTREATRKPGYQCRKANRTNVRRGKKTDKFSSNLRVL